MYWRLQDSTERLSHLLQAFGIRDTGLQHRTPFIVGDHVCVRRSVRAPLSGHTGRIIEIDVTDARGPYLTQFSNGLQFRYQPGELQRIAREIA